MVYLEIECNLEHDFSNEFFRFSFSFRLDDKVRILFVF